MRIGMIGAGGIAGVHEMAIRKLPDVTITAVVDLDVEKAKKIAEPYGANVYSSIDEMLNKESLDMVDICLPTFLHAEVAIKAMNHRIHVLCEKPAALHLEDAESMVNVARNNDVYFMVAHVIRFWPEYMYLKKVYDEKLYGDLKQISFSRLGQIPSWSWEDWMVVPSRSGRAPVDLHIHDTDFILYLLGKPKAIMSSGVEEGKIISYISTQYIYEDIVVTAEGGWFGFAMPFDMTYKACFEKAVLEFRKGNLVLYPAEGEPEKISLCENGQVDSGINISSVDGYFNEIKYFTDCIRNGTPPTNITPEESCACLELVLKEVESATTKKIIEVS